MAGGGGTGRALLSLSFSSSTLLLSRSLFSSTKLPLRQLRQLRPLSLSAAAATTTTTPATTDTPLQPLRHSILLDRIRSRHLKDAAGASYTSPKGSPPRRPASEVVDGGEVGKKKKMGVAISSFEELGLSEEVMGALKELGISVPTEIQCIGVPAVLEGNSVVLGSHTGSGKTLAYMLPLVQGISDLNRLITSFAKAGDLVSAREVFEKMIERDVVSWNSMMSAYAHDGWYNQVLQTFSEMHQQGVKPSQTSFSIILSSCARFKCLTFGKLIHSLSIKAGSSTNEFVGTSLITMYSECNSSDYLMKVFNDFEHRNVASWNALISGFLLNGLVEDAHEVFNHMPCRNVVSWTAMIHGYVEIKKVRSALELFNLMPVKNSVSWSVMLGGFVSNGQYEEAVALFKKLLSSGTKVTVAIILKVVNACLGLKSPKVGKKIHGYVIKLGFGLDPGIEASLITMYFGCLSGKEAKSVFDNMDSKFVGSWNSLINGYINNDEVDKARKWFDRMTERDKMSWNLMIRGYLRANRVDDALELFSLIPEFAIEAYTGLISGFIEIGKVGEARQLFDAMPERDVTAYTAMIYGHLEEGSLNDALELFIEMPTRNAVTYNIMISGLAHHGKIKQAYQIFNETTRQGAAAWNALVVGFARNEVNSELLRDDEALHGRLMKPRRPRAAVLCPTRELCEQVFRVAKSICHHARFRSTLISGGGRLRPQEDSLNVPVDLVVGTPGRILQHIEEGNMVYGDIKYLVLDEADTMFDRGFGPDIRKFLGPLKTRASKPDDHGFQTVLVTATMTQAVQKLVDEEFQGINHLRTSSLHKKVASARHDFIKLSGSENKLEALLQVLEPSLARGNRVMVFCNTLNSSRAVDHFLTENQISTVNSHGEVPAEQRVENLKKFKSDEGDCPTLVCTDLAARGLDLDVDHVIMFDFPLNSIDYLHRTGRTARMGAKGKVTSLVAKKDALLASRVEEAIRKNESLESLNAGNVRRDAANSRQSDQKGKNSNSTRVTDPRKKMSSMSSQTSTGRRRVAPVSNRKTQTVGTGKPSMSTKSRKVASSKPTKAFASGSKGETLKEKIGVGNRKSASIRSAKSKLKVVGFRGCSSSKKEASRTS